MHEVPHHDRPLLDPAGEESRHELAHPCHEPSHAIYDIPRDAAELARRVLEASPLELAVAQQIARAIAEIPADPAYNGVEPRALIVGGFVRCAALGQPAKDLDLEVYGVHPVKLEETLERLFPGKVNTVGRSFGILKIAIPGGLELDVSIPRRESKQGNGHRGFVIEGDPSLDVTDAAERRDFTWNALAADPLTGEVIDKFGGLDDLRAGLLRVTNPEKFQEDPLRVYRAAQFVARMGLEIDERSFALMEHMVERGDLTELTKERVTEELEKLLLRSPRPSLGLELMRKLGVLERYFPELQALAGTPQDPEWHPEGDVWTHTMIVVDNAARVCREQLGEASPEIKLRVMLGALLHDAGKPATTVFKDGHIRSPGHEEEGMKPAKALLSRLSFGHEVDRAVIQLVGHHMQLGAICRSHLKGEIDGKQFDNTIRMLVRSQLPAGWIELKAVTEADWRGCSASPRWDNAYKVGEMLEASVRKQGLDLAPAAPLLLGRDLIAMGLVPGPRFGKIISEIEQHRDRGRIETRDQALAHVRNRHMITAADLKELGVEGDSGVGRIMMGLRPAIAGGVIATRSAALEAAKLLITG